MRGGEGGGDVHVAMVDDSTRRTTMDLIQVVGSVESSMGGVRPHARPLIYEEFQTHSLPGRQLSADAAFLGEKVQRREGGENKSGGRRR